MKQLKHLHTFESFLNEAALNEAIMSKKFTSDTQKELEKELAPLIKAYGIEDAEIIPNLFTKGDNMGSFLISLTTYVVNNSGADKDGKITFFNKKDAQSCKDYLDKYDLKVIGRDNVEIYTVRQEYVLRPLSLQTMADRKNINVDINQLDKLAEKDILQST